MSHSPTPRNASRSPPRARLSAAEWRELEVHILELLDIKAAYESMGVRFTGRSSNGRLLCHAVDRVEKGASDSAGVNVGNGPYRGRYYDFGGQKLSLNLWEFGAQFGGFADWKECRRHFAGVAGVPYPDQPEFVRPAHVRRPAAPPRPAAVDDRIRENIGRDLDDLHAFALASGELDRTACRLHVHRDALIAQRMGYAPFLPDLRPYTFDDAAALIFPESQVVGLKKPQRQSADRRGLGESKRKQALFKRPRGVTIARDWHVLAKESGHILVCEGASDVAAIYSMGLGVLGIPMKGACAEEIALLIARAIKKGTVPADVAITLMVDRDDDKGGYASMQQLAQHIADALQRPVAGRYAPTVRGYHPEYREFPGVRLPFDNDESDPRWAAWHKRKGVAKDSREWLGWVCNAETLSIEPRREIGRRFLVELEPAFDALPGTYGATSQDVDAKAVAAENASGRAELVSPCNTNTDTEEECGRHFPNRLALRADAAESTQPLTDSAVATTHHMSGVSAHHKTVADAIIAAIPLFDPDAPSPLDSLPRIRPCLKNANREFWCRSKANPHQGFGLNLRCHQWGCEGCRTYLVSRWARHLESVFRLPPKAIWSGPWAGPMPLPTCYWRGPRSGRDRITQYIVRHKGQYVRITDPTGRDLIISTIPFPRGKRLDFNATAEMVAAILAIKLPFPAPKRFAPISTSTGWRPPPPPKTGESRATGWTNGRTQSHNVLRAMGVVVTEEKHRHEPRKTYRSYPGHWTEAHCTWADTWAMSGTLPPGYMPGDLPIDPTPYWEALRDAGPDFDDLSDVA